MHNDAGMTLDEKRAGTRYVWEFSAGMAGFVVLFLFLPMWWHTSPDTTAHLIRTLLPVVPLLWAGFAMWRHLHRVDEMQRAVLTRSFAFGFAAAMLTTLIIGLLRGGAIEIPGSEWIIFVVGMTSWGIAIPVNMVKSNQ